MCAKLNDPNEHIKEQRSSDSIVIPGTPTGEERPLFYTSRPLLSLAFYRNTFTCRLCPAWQVQTHLKSELPAFFKKLDMSCARVCWRQITHTHTVKHMHLRERTHTNTRMHTHAHVRTHACAHTHAHTHTHSHTHT